MNYNGLCMCYVLKLLGKTIFWMFAYKFIIKLANLIICYDSIYVNAIFKIKPNLKSDPSIFITVK